MPSIVPAALLLLLLPPPPPAATPEWKGTLLVQLQVQDLERSVRFYTGALGFEVTERRDDLRFVHLDCRVAGLQLGLSAPAPETASPPPSAAVVLNFGVRDLDAVRAGLEARGVVFDGPTLDIPGKVRLAGFRDPDGHRLRLAQSAP